MWIGYMQILFILHKALEHLQILEYFGNPESMPSRISRDNCTQRCAVCS
jgi:hypothetical protein